ncbi:basic proline-rich protein-like [Felis catus]|uniref:basic proline-rich protein-like n=1 Tax=Felis catus TaxID=9685 RepID=UPI001D19A6ED|nr:basic proline-rich protein-like [Felis catus]
MLSSSNQPGRIAAVIVIWPSCAPRGALSNFHDLTRAHARARAPGEGAQGPRALEGAPRPSRAPPTTTTTTTRAQARKAPASARALRSPPPRPRSGARRPAGGTALTSAFVLPPTQPRSGATAAVGGPAQPTRRGPTHSCRARGRAGGARQSPEPRSAARAGDATPDPGRRPPPPPPRLSPLLRVFGPTARQGRAVGTAAPGPGLGKGRARCGRRPARGVGHAAGASPRAGSSGPRGTPAPSFPTPAPGSPRPQGRWEGQPTALPGAGVHLEEITRSPPEAPGTRPAPRAGKVAFFSVLPAGPLPAFPRDPDLEPLRPPRTSRGGWGDLDTSGKNPPRTEVILSLGTQAPGGDKEPVRCCTGVGGPVLDPPCPSPPRVASEALGL